MDKQVYHKYYPWNELMRDCERIANACKKDYKIKYIYGPPRGGSVFAVILSHKLNAKYLTSLEEKHIPKNTLIVDDVSDTGKTFNNLIKNKSYITASAYIKIGTKYIPNIYCRIVSRNIWIDYPWEITN